MLTISDLKSVCRLWKGCPFSSDSHCPAKQVHGIHKHFKTKKGLFVAVDGVTIDVEPNTLVALLGPSGSGTSPWVAPQPAHVCRRVPMSLVYTRGSGRL